MQVKSFHNADLTNTIVCPRLQKVLEGINLKRPLVEFYYYNKVLDHGTADGVRIYKIVEVDAWQQGMKLGRISSHVLRNVKDGTQRWFGVTSPHIRKSRGYNREQLVCKEVDKTIKNAIDNLIKPTLETYAQTVSQNASQIVGNTINRITQKMCDSLYGRFGRYGADTTVYMLEVALGKNPVLPAQYASVTPEVEAMYNKYKAAEAVGKRFSIYEGYALQLLPNNTWFCTPIKQSEWRHATVYQTTADMPQFLQEKVTMLKLLEKDEFVADIGVRVCNLETEFDPDTPRLFYVVDGETKVQ